MEYQALRLADYSVSVHTGFLPAQDPLLQLPDYFAPWERVARQLSPLLITGGLREAIHALPLLETDALADEPERHRAMLLLTMLGSAYVWGGATAAQRMPAVLAVPLWQLAGQMGLPPIVCHTYLVLHNWQRLDPAQPITLENLAPLQLFLGGMDEHWFYMVTVAIEAQGGAVVESLLGAQQGAAFQQPEAVSEHLSRLEDSLTTMLAILRRMPEHCDPYIFYHRVRPYVASWQAPGMVYEGISETPQPLVGGSAAQSPLLQAIDAGLGIVHDRPETHGFLREMRRYMLPAHRQFIELIEGGASIREFVQQQQHTIPQMVEVYNRCIALLDAFRQTHLEISVRYIAQQAKQEAGGALGTGGTDFVPLLSTARKETRAQHIAEEA